MSRALTFALGIAADALLGDPPTRLHPVGLLGNAGALLHAYAPDAPRARHRYGLAAAAALPVAAALATSAARRAAARRHAMLGMAAESALFSLTSSARTLFRRASEVEAELVAGDLDAARGLLGTHLVSRDTASLDAHEVAAATIESVAENLSDAVIAPWLAYALGGLPLAAAYRAANTLDAMWGYRTPEFEELGSGVARLDDALNILPARLTALGIVLAARSSKYGAGCSASRAAATWRRDAGQTASPNAGHPMAAMAGALGVRLEKRDTYALGAQFGPPAPADVGRAVLLAQGAARYLGAGMLGAVISTRGFR